MLQKYNFITEFVEIALKECETFKKTEKAPIKLKSFSIK